MNDQERLAALLQRLESLPGLEQRRYDRLSAELDRSIEPFGYDAQGRLKVALFDAKPYDVKSFAARNVVPEPMNGSRITPAGVVGRLITCCMTATGLDVGCFVRSASPG